MWTAADPALAQRKPKPTTPAPRKPTKKELAREEARKKEEERRRKEEEARQQEEARRAEAQRQAAELELQKAKATEAAMMLQASQAALLDGRRYLDQTRRDLRRANDEIASVRAAAGHGFLALPIIFDSPETNLGIGAFGLYYFHIGAPDETRTSNVRGSFTYTAKKQALFDIGPTLWLANNAVNVNAFFTYDYYPNFFAGIGNRTPSSAIESYTERLPAVNLQFQYRLVGKFYGGVRYRFESRSILDKDPGRALDSGSVVGADGGVLSGLGGTLSFDSRDNLDAPARGTYAYLGVRQNFRQIGSDYRFTEVDVDLRHYIALGDNVLALQLVGGTNAGNAPFYALSSIGGISLLRGVTFGRFRDSYMTEGQVDFRFPIWGPWSGAAFFGAGEVMHTLPDFKPNGLHPAGGAGLRFAIVPSERLRIRLDFAYGDAGLAYYLNIGEAF